MKSKAVNIFSIIFFFAAAPLTPLMAADAVIVSERSATTIKSETPQPGETLQSGVTGTVAKEPSLLTNAEQNSLSSSLITYTAQYKALEETLNAGLHAELVKLAGPSMEQSSIASGAYREAHSAQYADLEILNEKITRIKTLIDSNLLQTNDLISADSVRSLKADKDRMNAPSEASAIRARAEAKVNSLIFRDELNAVQSCPQGYFL